MEFQLSTRKCVILFIVGIGCSILTYMIYITDPTTMLLEYNLQMSPNSILFSLWKKPPLDVFIHVYIFNITNPIEFLSGKEILKVQEIGPYVYRELLVNDNITFNDNDTLSYITRRTVVYVPEMSISDPVKDMVNVVNIPFLGISSALADAGFMVNYPWVKLANVMNAKPILNMSVYDYLWGFDDSLVKVVNGIMPNFINFQKFGLLDRIYDEDENIITVLLKKSANMVEEKDRYLSIDKYNGSPGMSQWGYIETESNETRKENTICNTLQGATQGILFPPNTDKRIIFRVFRKAFCRPLPIAFKKEVWTDNGIPGYLYTYTNNVADPPDQNPDNECYCRKLKTCLKKGLSNVSPCYYNIPMAMSSPHFLDADPSLLKDVEGLKPDRKKHESFFILQQRFGVPIFVHYRIQGNLIMHRSRYNSKIAVFNDLTLPLLWFDISVTSLPLNMVIIFKLFLQILPVVQMVLMYLLGIIGVTTSVLLLISIIWRFSQQEQRKQEMAESNDNPDLCIPLCKSQCTSINILSIKTITPQTDCLIDN